MAFTGAAAFKLIEKWSFIKELNFFKAHFTTLKGKSLISNTAFSNLKNGYLELISKLLESRWDVVWWGMSMGDAMIAYSR